MVQKVRTDPERLGSKSLSPPSPPSPSSFLSLCDFQFPRAHHPVLRFHFRCQLLPGRVVEAQVRPPDLSDSDTLFSQLSSISSATTIIAPDLMSQFEINFWYHGLSENPPKLMWRSDFETNPFRMPKVGEHFFKPHPKTAFGVFNTRLNQVWDSTIAPRILDLLKARGLKRSALKTARFLTVNEEDGTETWSPTTVWIAVHPKTTNAAAVRDVTPDVLQILNDAQVYGAVVEWYEGTVERLAGLPLMSVADNTSPTFGLSHPFNTGLGIPIARASEDAQGTVTLFFREVKIKDGEPSDRILALTNKHVATLDTTTHYDFDASNPLSILVCGEPL